MAVFFIVTGIRMPFQQLLGMLATVRQCMPLHTAKLARHQLETAILFMALFTTVFTSDVGTIGQRRSSTNLSLVHSIHTWLLWWLRLGVWRLF